MCPWLGPTLQCTKVSLCNPIHTHTYTQPGIQSRSIYLNVQILGETYTHIHTYIHTHTLTHQLSNTKFVVVVATTNWCNNKLLQIVATTNWCNNKLVQQQIVANCCNNKLVQQPIHTYIHTYIHTHMPSAARHHIFLGCFCW